VFKLPLNGSEKVTCGFFSDNDINFLVGTDQGTLFIASIKPKKQITKTELRVCQMRNLGKINRFEPELISQENIKMRTHQKKNSDMRSVYEPRSENIDGQIGDVDYI
jgi:hypothetical protein